MTTRAVRLTFWRLLDKIAFSVPAVSHADPYSPPSPATGGAFHVRPPADIDRDIAKAARELGRAYSQERGAVADQRRLLATLAALNLEREEHT